MTQTNVEIVREMYDRRDAEYYWERAEALEAAGVRE